MANKMLIDATHPEETRVVVVREHRVEEFDYESASKKQLRGSIYLAKVTRVEPSLQAAFVNYGGNRHGFLPFNEIHPDYYHLPLAERQALKQEEQRASRAAQSRGRSGGRNRSHRASEGGEAASREGEANAEDETENGSYAEAGETVTETFVSTENTFDGGFEDDPTSSGVALEAALPQTRYSGDLYAPSDSSADEDDEAPEADYGASDLDDHADTVRDVGSDDDDDDDDDDDEDDGVEIINDDGEHPVHARGHGKRDDAPEPTSVESIGSEDALEELPERIRRRRRAYKIQEVIKRGQILLVQVVKEERGNKGAALTTYLSLAGRYTVLMPNTGSGGGISRKISSPADRKRLREIAGELDVSEGMGLIVRTAGASRTKSEIKRDYEYLLRLWENVREMTLQSSAPCLVYEEGDLIKRSIRDLYNRDIDEILVAGDNAYRDAKDFMRMLMPSHAKNVQLYKDPEPLFIRYEVERQLNAMFSPQVTLPSGGYIVLNQTEALVAIDVNSGKSTREFSIEDTALKTNLEASDEIARQLRLRDLAGLIVVDFIDMEEKRNNRSVERKLKECLRNDRARIQVGRISHFGLLEMSRQRLRTGMIEGSTCSCPTCQGTGFVRSTESVALSVLRGLEDWLRTNQPANLNALTSTEVALYILNHKRGYLHDIEQRYGVTLSVSASERVFGGSFHIEKLSPVVVLPPSVSVSMSATQMDYDDKDPIEDEEAEQPVAAAAAVETDGESDDPRRSRRRRRRRRGRGDETGEQLENMNGATVDFGDGGDEREDGGPDDQAEAGDDGEQSTAVSADDEEGGENGNRRRSRRRGRRGGRHQRARQMRDGTVLNEDGSVDESAGAREGGEDAPMAANPDSSAQSNPSVRHSPQPEYHHDTRAVEAPAPAHRRNEPALVVEDEPTAVQSQPAPVPPEPVQPRPLPAPAMETVSETREPEPKERRSRHNGNGVAHPAPATAEAASSADEAHADSADVKEQAPSVVELPSTPGGGRKGWWQRR